MKRLAANIAAMALLVFSCAKERAAEERKTPEDAGLDVKVTFRLPDTTIKWQAGDTLRWTNDKAESVFAVLKGEDIECDSVSSTIFHFDRLASEDARGYFSLNCKADGKIEYTEGRSDSRIYSTMQENSGKPDRNHIFLVSTTGYTTIPAGTTEWQTGMMRIGGILSINTYTRLYQDEKIKSVSIIGSKDISGTCIMDHAHESRTELSGCNYPICRTVLAEAVPLDGIDSKELAVPSACFVLPPQTITDYSLSVNTDKASYEIEKNAIIPVRDGKNVSLCFCLDDYPRRVGTDVTEPVKVKGISLDYKELALVEGGSMMIHATIAPADATNRIVFWESSDTTVLKVSDGLLSAISAGYATVTASSYDGNFKARCHVSVSPAGSIGNNRHYELFIKDEKGEWQEIQVRDALCSNSDHHGSIWNDWGNKKQLRDTMSYAVFENGFNGPIEFKVRKKGRGFTKAAVRPTLYSIETRQNADGSIEFTIPSYAMRKVSVEFDDDRYHNLFLFGCRPDPDKPSPNTAGVRYYGPGEYDCDEIRLAEGETLYVDFGAVLYTNILMTGSNCTIAGNGIISGEKLPHTGDKYSTGKFLIEVNQDCKKNFKGARIRNVTLIDSPAWTIRLRNQTDFEIDNINMICWILNGDGIDVVHCQNSKIHDCFIRAYDDAITIKEYEPGNSIKDNCNIEIYNNLIWNDFARGIVIGPEAGSSYHSTGHTHDIDVHDCTFLHQDGSDKNKSDVIGCFCIDQVLGPNWNKEGGTAQPFKNIHAWNLVFDNIYDQGRNVYIFQNNNMSQPAYMENITLENFVVLNGNNVKTPICHIKTNKNYIKNLKIRNFTVDGRPIRVSDTELCISGNVEYTLE